MNYIALVKQQAVQSSKQIQAWLGGNFTFVGLQGMVKNI